MRGTRVAALRRMKNPDRGRIEAFARKTEDGDAFRVAANFLDDTALLDIAATTSLMHIAEAAIGAGQAARRAVRPEETIRQQVGAGRPALA